MEAGERTKGLKGQPLKLNDGSWGAWVEGEHDRDDLPGREVEITTRSGKSWTREVARVLWSGTSSRGDKGAIVSLAGGESGKRERGRPRDPARAAADWVENTARMVDRLEGRWRDG